MKTVRAFSFFISLALATASGCNTRSTSTGPAPEPSKDPAKAAAPGAAAGSAGPIYTTSFTPAERRDFYHLPEGGELLPLELLRNLESIRTFKPFMEDLDRFRLIADPEDPDGLPVGMSAMLSNGKRAEPRMVFFNCAACHTSEITYQGKVLRIEGAPGHVDVAGFIGELLSSIDSTLANPQRLAAYVGRMKPQPLPLAEGKKQLQTALDVTQLLKEKIVYLQRLRGLRPTTTSGYGRLDAFVAARNLLFGEKYAIDVNSPVSLPPIFGFTRLGWFHFDNNTNSILQRNIGEDLGVGAVADLNSGESTVQLRSLVRLEALAAKLTIPKWPESLLGKLDAARVPRGGLLYQQQCATCHETSVDGKFPDRVVSLAQIGTDPNRSVNFGRPVGADPFAKVLGAALDKVEKKSFEREGVTAAEAATLEPPQVIWRTTAGYSARPIDGMWATAPYLHNGSVPTLHDLLLPPAQRPKTFLTGSREFDPKKVGFATDGAAGATFLLDTSLDGNHNSGHTYGTALSDEERLDLLEYLKSR